MVQSSDRVAQFHRARGAIGVIFALNIPFLPKTFLQFIEKFEKDVCHPITLLYWVDQQSGGYLKDRPGWTMTHREKIFKIHGLMMASCPQGFSVWKYEPTGEPDAPIPQAAEMVQ